MKRRSFLFAAGAAAFARPPLRAAEAGRPYYTELRKPGPYEALRRYIGPGADGYACEKEAMEVEAILNALPASKALPLAADFSGPSPVPARLRRVDHDVSEAEFTNEPGEFSAGLQAWLASLGEIRRLRFIPLAEHRVRFEAAGTAGGRLTYRVGHWHMEWSEGRLTHFRPLDETRVERSEPMFADCSEALFGASAAWRDQLLHGTPYWRSRLDSACGIDIYGSNGISAADIDNDGWDELYVSQPGGLPNRLFKRCRDGAYEDISARTGLDLLDDTSCALFLDYRNCGVQDVVVLRPSGPLYFVNDGGGRFRLKPEAFRFARPVEGTFTGMAAADYDRDGRLDLYLCTYVYFQSEDRYRYPVPYHDAQVGPPNFLLRNHLGPEGDGAFEDVTESSGINQNNNRYSFAAAWCDYDGSGWPSLYVANDFGRNNLYRNEGGKFRDVAAAAGVEDIGPGMGASWFDYDGDGRPDLYVSNMWTPAGQRVVADSQFPLTSSPELKDAYHRHTKGNSLYRNRGDGTFEEVADAGGAAVGRWAWGAEGVDFDNDGTPEIAIAAGMLTNSNPVDMMSFFWRQVVSHSPAKAGVAPEYENGWNSINQYIREEYSWNGNEPNVLYVRKGGRYRDYSGVSGLDFADDTRTFAVTDFDGDGNLDLVLKSRRGPQIRALQNRAGRMRNSVAFALRGISSNRDAVGATVTIHYAGRTASKTVTAGSGYLSQHTKPLYFGLDGETAVARATIRWPSGTIQTFDSLASGHLYSIVENSQETAKTPFAKPQSIPTCDMKGDDHVSLAPTWLLHPVPLPDERKGPGFVLITDGRDAAASGLPVDIVDLTRSDPGVGAAYTLFRRYLFDWRAPLTLPLLILIDSAGQAHKIYPDVPPAGQLRGDLEALRSADRQKLALPFAGWYAGKPARNYYKLGAAFVGAGYPEQALPYLKAAVAQWDGNFKAWLALGQVYLEGNRLPEARSSLNRALTLNANSPEVWNNLGGVAMAEGHNEEALRAFDRMLSIAPDSVYGLTNCAVALGRLKRTADAERMYRRALQIDPRDSDTADRLGLLLAQSGRIDEAIGLFKQALTNDPRHASAINNLGVAYMQAGKTSDAIAAFQYGARVAPEHDMIALNLARVYVAEGNRDKAREVLKAFLARVPRNAIVSRALEQLGEP